MKTGDLVYIDDITTGFVLGIVLQVVNPYPDEPNYEKCDVFWNRKPSFWMVESGTGGTWCASHILKVVR